MDEGQIGGDNPWNRGEHVAKQLFGEGSDDAAKVEGLAAIAGALFSIEKSLRTIADSMRATDLSINR